MAGIYGFGENGAWPQLNTRFSAGQTDFKRRPAILLGPLT
jgi:hypothetical protein